MKGIQMILTARRKLALAGISTVALVALLSQNAQAATVGHRPPPAPSRTTTTPTYSPSGTGNNVANSTWGSTQTAFSRKAPAAYTDGISTPAGSDRESARVISNAINADTADTPNVRGLSDLLYVFGQFLDHDITRTTGTSGASIETLQISIPTGDPEFDPLSTGTQTMSLKRSAFAATTGLAAGNPRQQTNSVTSFIDGSMVYGSDTARASALRTLSGGTLKTSSGNMLPLNTMGLSNDNDARVVPNESLFVAGDERANENPSLVALQTLFMREHNRIATALAVKSPLLTDEQLYQKARTKVIAELQWITYNEFLPALLGNRAMPRYSGYKTTVNPSISNEFATAAFRFGHSMLDGAINRMNDDGTTVPQGNLTLRESFFNTTVFDSTLPNHEGDIDPFLKAAATGTGQEVDVMVVDDVRNFLFGAPGSGGFDLAAINIERGRDHGLADYNTVRAAYGLPKLTSFAQITTNTELAASLESTYTSIDNVDLWVAGLAEDHVRGGSLGPLFTRIVTDQFTRLRTGDRLYFEAWMPRAEQAQVKRTSLASIIRANTSLTTIQPRAFFATTPAS
jgi:hypothetical protein